MFNNMPMSIKTKKYSQLPTTDKVALMLDWLREKKAQDLTALDLTSMPGPNIPPTESIVVATASSVRHAQGLADYLLQRAGEEGFEYLNMEGYVTGSWILLDFNDILVNIFQTDNRDLYRLEDLWHAAARICDERTPGGAQ